MRDHAGHEGVQERALGVAYNLSTLSEDRCETFVKLGLIGLAVSDMKAHPNNRGVQEEGCSALFVLMQTVPDIAAVPIEECGGLAVVKIAKETHEDDKRGVVKWASKAIAEIEAHRKPGR